MTSQDQFRCFSAEDLRLVNDSTFVRNVEHHAVLPSTNSHALARASDPQSEVPLLILADHQSAGRGRGTNPWWSAAGALTFSLILERPQTQDVASWLRVSLTAGIAVCEALHQLCPGLDAGLKWPNDVYVRSRKICGILVEIPPQAARRMVVGVGVNVNNAVSQAPSSLHASATSLVDFAGYPFRLTGVLLPILKQISAHVALLQHDPTRLQQHWQTFCMLTGRTVEVVAGTRRAIGCCQGINAQGALLIDTPTGLEQCLSGEVVSWE